MPSYAQGDEMSYILEALKKSDQQRQRGTTPTLPLAQITVVTPKQPFSAYYGLLAITLLCGGIVIGWLHPWQEEQPDHAADRPSVSNQGAPITSTAPPEMTGKLPMPNSTGGVQAPLRIDTMQPGISSSASTGMAGAVVSAPPPMPGNPTNPAGVAKDQKVIPMVELPLTIQQEIPTMTIQLHSYSSNPLNSLVNINSRMLKEGESLAPGLKLEQITPDGVIFSYKGYRFQHGIW
jgi:general secretion pathway protein B